MTALRVAVATICFGAGVAAAAPKPSKAPAKPTAKPPAPPALPAPPPAPPTPVADDAKPTDPTKKPTDPTKKASSDPRVAVVVELAVNVEPTRVEALSAALADALNRELEVDAFGGGDVERRLPAGGLPEDCLATPKCTADIAARLDVPQLLVIAVVQVGDDIQIDSSWVEVATAEVLARPRIVLAADARAGEVFAAQATRLLPRAHKRPLSVVGTIGGYVPGPSRRMTRTAWIAGGAGVAALAGSIGFGLSVRASYDRCDPKPCTDDEKSSIRTRAAIADGLFAGALIGATTAVVLYLRSAKVDEEAAAPSSPSLTVTPTAGGAVVGLLGGF